MNIIGCDHQLINDTSICLIDIAVISANIIELECNETTTMKLEWLINTWSTFWHVSILDAI